MSVEARIRAYLDDHGISQIHLSERTNIPAPKLNLSLNGKRKLNFGEYQTICWALNVGVDEFMEPKPPNV